MKSYRIRIPLSDGTPINVKISEGKTYNGFTCKDLLQRYKYNLIPKTDTLIHRDNLVFIPSGILSEIITIRGREIKTRELFNLIEETTNRKILLKYELRAIKLYRNVSLELPPDLKL